MDNRITNIKQRVLSYWFDKIDMEKWFGGKIDNEIKERFSQDLRYAEGIVRYSSVLWTHSKGCVDFDALLSLIVVLDQFSRNVYRGTMAMYKNDPFALSILLNFLSAHSIETICKRYKDYHLLFLLMPLQHTTNKKYQQNGIILLFQIINYKYKICLDKFITQYMNNMKSIPVLRQIQKQIHCHTILGSALYHQIGHYIVLLKFNDFPKRYTKEYVMSRWGQEGMDHLKTKHPY